MEKRGGALNIFSIFYTHHRIPNEHMMTINFDTITNNYEVIYVIKTVMKYYLEKIDTSVHQRLLNMVQRVFADVIHDAIWFIGGGRTLGGFSPPPPSPRRISQTHILTYAFQG